MMKSKLKIGSGEVKRFDQRNTMYCRVRDPERSDPAILEIGRKHYGVQKFGDKSGYTRKDWAFALANAYLEKWWGFGTIAGDAGLYTWYPDESKLALRDRMEPGEKWVVNDTREMSRDIKKVALYLGASLVGICKLNRRWIYTHRFNFQTHEHTPIEISDEFQYAVVMAHEMNYELIRTSPAFGALAATGQGYSMMAFIASSLAHYIRLLGYKAIPSGNDTALNIPIAIDAGLGELGRHGMLISERFGPRVRLSKVFTNLPLMPDKPIEFGVQAYCETCKLCAENCPSRAITRGDPTTEGPSLSSNSGIYKWYIDPEKCLDFFQKNQGACANCIRVCSFNKSRGKIHDAIRFLVRKTPCLNPLLVRTDKLFGYGSRIRTEDVWNKGN